MVLTLHEYPQFAAVWRGCVPWVFHALGVLFLAAVLRHAHFVLLGILTLGALAVIDALCLTHPVGLRLVPDRSTFRLGGSGGVRFRRPRRRAVFL